MNNVSNIPVTKVAAGSNGVAGAQALAGSATSGVLSGSGMANFWDMIIAQFSATTETQKSGTNIAGTAADGGAPATTPATDAQTKKNTQTGGDNPLALLQLALSTQTVDTEGNIVIEGDATSATKIERQLELTNTIINHLKNALPENGEKDGVMAGILSKLQAKSDTLRASLSAIEGGGTISKDTPVKDLPLPILIALGLNPAEITEVSEKIQDLQEKLGRDITVEDLIAGVGGILPATPEQAVVALKSTGDNSKVLESIDENSQPTDDLAAQLNALDVGSGDTDKPATGDTPELAAGEKKKDPQAGLTNIASDSADPEKTDGIAKSGEQAADQTKPENGNAHTKKDAAAFKEHLVNMLNTNRAQHGAMVFPVSYTGADADNALFQPYGYSSTPSLSLGTTAQAANMISSPATAGQNHPGSQLVAATLTKAAKGGEDSTINLRLDPPELGNVAVRLQFGKDKSVKAHVTVEKPETYMMLQREGHSLERALQSAGLDTQGQAISFELAQDNSAFQQNNNSGNSNFGNGGGKALVDTGGAEEIIQSSMTWQVDPSTGRMRYNILA